MQLNTRDAQKYEKEIREYQKQPSRLGKEANGFLK